MAKSYRSQYLDPRWQKKRLEVMEQQGFTCQRCETTEKTLSVHHNQYIPNRDVWDYENSQLSVLCQDCHADLHAKDDLLNDLISRIPAHSFERKTIAYLIGGFLVREPMLEDASYFEALHFNAGLLASRMVSDAMDFHFGLLREGDQQ
jgi:hypothetical protein